MCGGIKWLLWDTCRYLCGFLFEAICEARREVALWRRLGCSSVATLYVEVFFQVLLPTEA